jgi:hypothetical protein
MLATALDHARNAKVKTRKAGKKSRVEVNGDGLEGIGDSLISSPFDFLAHTPGSLDAALDEVDANASQQRGVHQTVSQEHPSAALRMLKIRLEAK